MGKCLGKNTTIRLKNNKTGEIKEIPIGEFFESLKKSC